MEILVIGTDPPCVRCLRTYQLARKILQEMAITGEVRKISFDSAEAKRYGKVGTAHDIAQVAGMTFPADEIRNLAQEWSSELDNKLMPFKKKAEQIGYLMTPVLIIDGKVELFGFVPSEEQFRNLVENKRKR